MKKTTKSLEQRIDESKAEVLRVLGAQKDNVILLIHHLQLVMTGGMYRLVCLVVRECYVIMSGMP